MRFSVPAELAEEGEHAEVIAEALARHKQELTERATRVGLTVHHKQERVSLDRVVL
jgi:tRNA threonylcarbamoyladenosine modification (KEOPS) complex  Pcc1 subunit